jgi:hypothetical protein
MGCEQYQSWMTDAALGALSTEREADLRAHVVLCASCREELDRSRQLLAAIDRATAVTVSAEPSPQFVARVRRQMAERNEPLRPRLAAWFPVAAGALALVALLAFWQRPQPSSTRGPSNAPPSTHEIASTKSVTPSVPTPATILKSSVPRAGIALPHRVERTTPSRGTIAPPKLPPALEVLVPPGEWQALAKFAAALKSGRIEGAQLEKHIEETRKPLNVVALEVPSIELPLLGAETPANESDNR